MSGGYFNYSQDKIDEIISSIEGYLDGEDAAGCTKEELLFNGYAPVDVETAMKTGYLHEPNEMGLANRTLDELENALEYLKKARIYTQRIDWLLSGDDSEESFHERLKEDLNNI